MTSNETIKNFPASDVPLGPTENFLETTLGNVDPTIKEVLLNPDILHRFKKSLDIYVTGEDKSKTLLFLICCTSFMQKKLGAIITGTSSAGKSHLLNSVLKFFFNVEDYTRITRASPDRMNQSFDNRILKVEELRGSEAAQSSLRVLISEGKLRLLTTTREDGDIKTEVIETIGVPVFVTTTTSISPDVELMNRLFNISIDETKNQTKKVLEFEAEEFMDTSSEEADVPEVLKKTLEFLATTPFNNVLIPYALDLAKAFPSDNLKARRDFKKLLNLIASVAWLYQFQRTIVYKEKIIQLIVAEPVDFYMTWRIVDQSLKETLMNVQRRGLEVLELFKDMRAEGLTSRQVAHKTGRSQNRVREILNGLVESGYLVKDTSQKEHLFRPKENLDVEGTIKDFEPSLTCETLKEWLKHRNMITRRHEKIHSEFVDPLTGVSSCYRDIVSNRKQALNGEIPIKDNSESLIVPLDDTEKPIVPPFELFITQLRGRVQNPTERSVFVTSIMEVKSCGPEEAERRFQKLVSEGFIVWLDEGSVTKYRWVR